MPDDVASAFRDSLSATTGAYTTSFRLWLRSASVYEGELHFGVSGNSAASCLCSEVQIRAQWIRREVLLPQPRRKFSHPRSRMLTDSLQNVDEIGVRVDAV